MPLSVWESISHHQEMLLPVVELSIKGFIALKTVTKMKKSGLKGLSLHCLEQDGALKGLSQRQWLRGIHEAWWLRHWPRMESKSISSLMHLAALGSSLSYSATGPGDGVATFLCLERCGDLYTSSQALGQHHHQLHLNALRGGGKWASWSIQPH